MQFFLYNTMYAQFNDVATPRVFAITFYSCICTRILQAKQ